MRNFKDLKVWERAHRFTLDVYESTRPFPKDELFGLTSQIRRSSSSIGANLAEGCGRRGDGEMSRFVTIAMGSASELEYHLLLARDLKILPSEKHSALQQELTEIRMMLSSLFVTVSKAARGKSAGA
jgi:four helix bundle protein